MEKRELPDPTALEIRDIEQAKGVHLSWDDEIKKAKAETIPKYNGDAPVRSVLHLVHNLITYGEDNRFLLGICADTGGSFRICRYENITLGGHPIDQQTAQWEMVRSSAESEILKDFHDVVLEDIGIPYLIFIADWESYKSDVDKKHLGIKADIVYE